MNYYLFYVIFSQLPYHCFFCLRIISSDSGALNVTKNFETTTGI